MNTSVRWGHVWSAGSLMLLVLLASSITAAADQSSDEEEAVELQWQLLDPFSLEMLAARARRFAVQDDNRIGNQGLGIGLGPPVDVPARPNPRSPYVPPVGGPPLGPPPWVL